MGDNWTPALLRSKLDNAIRKGDFMGAAELMRLPIVQETVHLPEYQVVEAMDRLFEAQSDIARMAEEVMDSEGWDLGQRLSRIRKRKRR